MKTTTTTSSSDGAMQDSSSQNVVHCVLAVDGGASMCSQWGSIAGGYIPAILRQLGNLHPGATIQISSITINSLPPTSRRPLIVKPFVPVETFLQTLPALLSKGKEREVTSDVDYALLEGLVVGASMLEAQQAASTASYMIVASASDIPNTNFWDEKPPHAIPSATLWQDVVNGYVDVDAAYSDAWNGLIRQLTKTNTHLCTISTRFLARLEEFQRRVAAAKDTPSQGLPNLQDPEHAILLSGFQLGSSSSSKRAHPESSPVQGLTPHANGQPSANKKVKLSPSAYENNGQLSGQAEAQDSGQLDKKPDKQTPQQQQAPFPPLMIGSLQYQQNPVQMPQQGTPQSGSIPLQQQNNQSQAGSPPLTPIQELQKQREEIKKQMKTFMNHLRLKAQNGEISAEKAKATAEKVRQEAAKKLQIMDALEAQHNSSPGIGQVPLPTLDAQQPPLVPSQSRQNTQDNQPQAQQAQYQTQNGQSNSNRPSHKRQDSTPQAGSTSANTPSVTGSPSKAAQAQPPVWSGPITWSMVDPAKGKKDLAFYVDAVPMRPNAVVELMNVQWPQTLEVSHISPMSMGELQKYSHDNRTQVVSFAKPPTTYLDQMGITQSQNEGLYQLLAKNLESKGSVAIVRMQTLGANRGIVIVALPGQTKLVGLVFLTSPLPPRTPASANAQEPQGQQGTMQQQQQQAMHLLDNQQQQTQYQQQQQPQLNQQQGNQYQQSLQQLNHAQQSYQQYQQSQSQHVPQSSPYASYSQPLSAFSVPSVPNTGNHGSSANPGYQLSDSQIQEMFQNLQRQQSGQM